MGLLAPVFAVEFAGTFHLGQERVAHSSIDGCRAMPSKLLVNHLHNDLGELFLLLVIQGKYHLDYLFNFRATLHLLSPLR